ncbi:MAG TPA: hypothetical protein VIA62_20610 [Thermoanaerobaculia bacterium]|nr:hypothetical protein [Thermoanaerobaculia bacterium]
MRRFVLGVILAALAMFVWGMLYWGANPLPYTTWKRSTDDVAAGQALLKYFPQNGTYYIPGMYHDKATLARMFQQGPVAFVHMLRREGRPMMDPSIMGKGIVLYLAVALLFAWVLRLALPALPTYGSRVKLAALLALVAVVMIDLGDAVWWYIPLDWKIQQGLYNLSALLVGGLVLARFVDARPGRQGQGDGSHA